MSLTGQKQKNVTCQDSFLSNNTVSSKDFILPGSVTVVKSYNIDTKEEEFVLDKQICRFCPIFLKTPGYCSDTGPGKGVAMSPRYHCNSSKVIEKY